MIIDPGLDNAKEMKGMIMNKKIVWFYFSTAYLYFADIIIRNYIQSEYELVLFSKDNIAEHPSGLAVKKWDGSYNMTALPDFVFFATENHADFMEKVRRVLASDSIVYGGVDDAAVFLLDEYGQMNFMKAKIEYVKPPVDEAVMEIGEFSYFDELEIRSEIRDGSLKCRIGKYCSLAPKVTVMLGEEHSGKFVSTYPFREIYKGCIGNEKRIFSKGDVVIGNDVWIGQNAIILSGVHIGDGCIVGAGAMVTKSIEPYSVIVGNPGKIIKKRFGDEDIQRLLTMKWWDWDYRVLFNALPIIQSESVDALWDYYNEFVIG